MMRREREALHQQREDDHAHRDENDFRAIRKRSAVGDHARQRERRRQRHHATHARPRHEDE